MRAIRPDMALREDCYGPFLGITMANGFLEGFLMIEIRHRKASKQRDYRADERDGDGIAVGEDIAALRVGDEALRQPGIGDLGVVAIEKNAPAE